MPTLSHAALTITSVTNTTSTFNAKLDWTLTTELFAIDTLGCGDAAPALSLGCTPWKPLQLTAIQFPQAPGAGQVALSLQHLIGPHIIDANPGVAGELEVLNVSPGVGSGFITVYTLHNPHYDRLTLEVAAIRAGLSEITITGDHSEVPEPGTLALGTLGGSMMALVMRYRRRKA